MTQPYKAPEPSFFMPAEIIEDIAELNELIAKYPKTIPLNEAAKYLKVSPAALQSSIERGQCPFGLFWQQDMRGRRAFKIFTTPFHAWRLQTLGYSNNKGTDLR